MNRIKFTSAELVRICPDYVNLTLFNSSGAVVYRATLPNSDAAIFAAKHQIFIQS